jgi:probable HAF family extracellular repeat protein
MIMTNGLFKMRCLVMVAALSLMGCEELSQAVLEATRDAPVRVPPRFRDLGNFGGESATATAINDAGVVVGFAGNADGDDHGFRWTAEEGLVDLGTAGGSQSRVFGINKDGVICGISLLAEEGAAFVAAVWFPDGRVVPLPHLFDGSSDGRGINDLGQVIGSSNDPDGNRIAVLWETDGTVVALDVPEGTVQSQANAINNLGQVVGTALTEDGETRGFYWSAADGAIDIGTLGGDLTEPNDIDDLGRVVGRSNSVSRGNRVAFVWSLADGMREIGTLGGTGSQGFALNESGIVVGSGSTGAFASKAFVGTLDGGVFQLPDLGSNIGNNALDVNSSGVIVGFVNTADRTSLAVIWE